MDNLGRQFSTDVVQEQLTVNASIPKRIGAFIIDLLFINIFLAAPFSDILAGSLSTTVPAEIPPQLYSAVISIAIVALLYFALLEYYEQQTLGMMAIGMRVEPEPSFWTSIARNLFILPVFPFNLLWIIEPVHLYFTGQRFLERLTGTDTVVAHG